MLGTPLLDAVRLSWSCLVHTVDRFADEGWFNCDQVIISTCFHLLTKRQTSFK